MSDWIFRQHDDDEDYEVVCLFADGRRAYPVATHMPIEDARLAAAAPAMLKALELLVPFVSVMVGRGPDCQIPETVRSPIGVDIKVRSIMLAANLALEDAREGTPK